MSFDAKVFLKTLTTLPGVYRMLNRQGQVIYVGKARNLKRRLSSYFRSHQTSSKISSLLSHVHNIEVTVTHTEGEALILENNLIKQFRPRYNILLRDDKGYPYLHLSTEKFPRLSLQRDARRLPGRYFGPYPNVNAVRETLSLLQKVFRLRQCEDNFFHNRSRPCLQYQIKRCSAPCTVMIDQESYQQDVYRAILFLEGKSGQVIDDLVQRMEIASAELKFEEAAIYRDQIVQLRQVQERQYVSSDAGNLDVVACTVQGEMACVEVLFFRDGRLLGNKSFFPQIPQGEGVNQVLSAFLAQHYLGQTVPEKILVSQDLEDIALLTEVLQKHTGRQITITSKARGERVRWLEMALRNAEQALLVQLSSQVGMRRRFEALQDALGLDFLFSRLECVDVSHTQGEATVAACIVFTEEGPLKSAYRRYNIEGLTPSDDYGAIRQALTRRYLRLRENDGQLPDILFIDGGKGQVTQAQQVLEELQVTGVIIIGIAKGADRKSGLEVLHLADKNKIIKLPADSAALHLVQQVRDEAHRFAITGHRQRRAKARKTSVLESISGIGQKRRQTLLRQFGGLKQLSRAGVEDIARVSGISKELAVRIYDSFHNED